MDPTADPMIDDAPETAQLPLLSSSKQTRINIWRTEVAALTLPPRPSSPSSSSHTNHPPTTPLSTTTTSSSSSTRSGISRGRRLLNKLIGRKGKKPTDEERTGRTDMYRGMMPPSPMDVMIAAEREDALSGDEANDQALRDKQERMERAARLLDTGAS